MTALTTELCVLDRCILYVTFEPPRGARSRLGFKYRICTKQEVGLADWGLNVCLPNNRVGVWATPYTYRFSTPGLAPAGGPPVIDPSHVHPTIDILHVASHNDAKSLCSWPDFPESSVMRNKFKLNYSSHGPMQAIPTSMQYLIAIAVCK